MTRRDVSIVDSDTLAIRRASRIVGTRLALVCTGAVALALLAMFLYILSEISAAELFEPVPDTDNLQVSAVGLLRAATVVGVTLIALAGIMSWLVTRNAVQPLGEALRIQRAFVADASHELRTPLAVLDARLQILQRSLIGEDPSAPIVAELRSDTKDLIDIVNDLLESAETSHTAVKTNVLSDVNTAVAVAVKSMEFIAAGKDVTIDLTANGPALAHVPAPSLTRCVVALLDNAVRFEPEGSAVEVIVDVTKKLVMITVRDHGPGIQGIAPARIFDRFAHTEATANGGGDNRTGFGIGLSLVRDIAVRHGGSVAVINSSQHGTAIRFAVPRAKRLTRHLDIVAAHRDDVRLGSFLRAVLEGIGFTDRVTPIEEPSIMTSTLSDTLSHARRMLNKVPEVTVIFWVIKVLATTVGETAADFLNVDLGLGLTITSFIMAALLAIALVVQFRLRKYTPAVYWLAVVLISIVGTLITDNLTDNLGVPLWSTTVIFAVALAATFAIWARSEKTLSIHSIFTTRRETFYWLAVLFTFALGTAAGDLVAEGLQLGFLVALLVFAAAIAAITTAYFVFKLNAVLAFWIAYILTRPLGASTGDLLSQPLADGGLGLGTTGTSVLFLSVILTLVIVLTLRAKKADARLEPTP